MTIGSPSARISASLVSVTGLRTGGSAGGRGGGDMLLLSWLTPAQPVATGAPTGESGTLSIRRTAPTRAATASTAGPSRRVSGSKLAGSTSATYSAVTAAP